MKILAWPAYKIRARNPFQFNLYTVMRRLDPSLEIVEFGGRTAWRLWAFDVLHIHWPEGFILRTSKLTSLVRILALALYFGLCRLVGVRIVWTAHNYKRGGAGSAFAERLMWLILPRLLSGTIYLTESSRRAIEADNPVLAAKPSVVIPHGDYRDLEPATLPAVEPVNLQYFGPINQYKNVPSLVRAFAGLPDDERVTLRLSANMSAASPDPQLAVEIGRLSAGAQERFRHEDAFQSDDELVAKVRAADLVVLPYHRVMNSGSAVFSLTFGTPILGARMPLFEELRAQVGDDWVMLFDGEIDAATLLDAWKKANALKASGRRPDMSAFDWTAIAAKTLEFYESLVARSDRSKRH